MSAPSLNRRQFLRAGTAAGVSLAAFPGSAPAFLRSRPKLTHGIQSGDVTADAGIVWARADRPSRMLVEVAATPRFNHARKLRGPILTPDHDFAGKVLVDDLPAGEQIFYRVTLEDLYSHSARSEPAVGSFTTAPRKRRDVSFTWSGDLAGQGWGINPDIGGYRIFKTMAGLEPDFFLCSGDTIYADGPLTETVALPGGRTWRNVVTPAKSKVCETLDDFRGAFAYNLLDDNLRAFAASVPPRQRDDVERIYRRTSHGPLLDVFMLDMRTYKDPNGTDVYADPTIGMLGSAQRAWLKRELAASRATWKVIANDLPLGLVVPDAPGTFEGVSQGDNGKPLGRELEFAEILRFAHQRAIGGIVFLTADVHYTSAHHYDPARAAIGDFTPFWEFVSGPLNAGAFGPNALDTTFGPQTVFAAAPPAANTSPADGFQFFGHVAIDGHSEVMTVTLYDLDGKSLFSTQLTP